jgi:hypothetical protein
MEAKPKKAKTKLPPVIDEFLGRVCKGKTYIESEPLLA